MSYAIYNYIQSYIFSHPPSVNNNQMEQIIRDLRDFFNQRRLIYINDPTFTNDSYLFLSVSQLLWQPVPGLTHLKPYFYSIPPLVQKQFKNFFVDLLQIKNQLDGRDLLTLIEQTRKRYGTKPIDRDDFNLLQNIYSLLIDHYSNVLNGNVNIYLPNIDGVLHLGSNLYFYPFERDQSSKQCSIV